jgi:hypothetical protein
MQKVVALLSLLLCLSVPLWSQDYPKAEIFGGYQFLHTGGDTGGVNANGWNASVTGNFNKSFGVTGDFSGAYKSVSGVSASIYTYTFGPVVSLNHEGPVNPFVHALFGGAHLGGSISGLGSASTNGFTMMFGGGVDAKVGKNLAIRVFQADWVYYRFSGFSESKNVRLSTGIVARF